MLTSAMLFVGGASTGMVLCLALGMLLHVWRKRRMGRISGKGSASEQEADPAHPTLQRMKRRIRSGFYRGGLLGALALAYGLYASAAVAQPTLGHVDPVVYAALQLSLLLPGALVLLGWTGRGAASGSVRLGFLGGLPLGVGFVCVALSLRTLGMIPTAMLTALDGLMASLISWLVFRQAVSLYTCLAALCASGGALLLWWVAPSRWQTDLVALGTGLLFTVYAFHVERHAIARGSVRRHLLPFLGGLLCSMSLTALLLACCFGRWESVQTITSTDLVVLVYCGFATVLIPQVLLTILLRHVSAVTMAFCAALEPLLSLGFASWWGTVSLDSWGWCGVSLILLSLLFQGVASRPPREPRPALTQELAEARSAPAEDRKTEVAL